MGTVKNKSSCGILSRLWLLGHPYGLLVVSTVSEGAPQNNHEEGKKTKNTLLSVQTRKLKRNKRSQSPIKVECDSHMVSNGKHC